LRRRTAESFMGLLYRMYQRRARCLCAGNRRRLS
jgi:hypothetical protein